MSKNNSSTPLGGGMQPQPQKKSNGSGSLRKMQKKPFKSNITNKVKSRHSGQVDVGEVESDDDGGGSCTIEDTTTTEDDPDVNALPDARQPKREGPVRRLAGHDIDDDDMFNDTNMGDSTQAIGGAGKHQASDDEEDDYADVEDVSDSDDDGEEMEGDKGILRSAERDLIDEFEKTEHRRNASLMANDLDSMSLRNDDPMVQGLGLPQYPFHGNDEFGFGVNMNEDPFYGFPTQGDEYQQMWGAAESSIWRMPETVRNSEASDPASTTQKRVRFEETHYSSPSGSEDEDPNDAFPDLFTPADDPSVSQSLSHDIYHGFVFPERDYGDNESFYDFEDEDEKLAFEIDEQSDSSENSADYNSSDDSDDATDEETPEEQIAKLEERKLAIRRSSESAPTTSIPEKRPTPKMNRATSMPRPATPKSGKGPRTGRFEGDPSRASIKHDKVVGKLTIEPPTRPLEKDKAFWERARTAVNSRAGSPQGSFHVMRSASTDSLPTRPFTARCTLGSMFNGNLEFMRNNDNHGIADDLLPTLSRRQTAFSSFTGTEDSDTDHRTDLHMQDFIHLNDSDSDHDDTQAVQGGSLDDIEMFEGFPSDAGHERRNSDLLDHFTQNRGVIGSFRRNQHFTKHISSQASHPAQRASTHEFNALQKGRRGAANTPITPARKKRASQDLTPNRGGVRKSMSSPLTSRRPRSRGNSLANADLLQTLTNNPFG